MNIKLIDFWNGTWEPNELFYKTEIDNTEWGIGLFGGPSPIFHTSKEYTALGAWFEERANINCGADRP